MQEVGAIRFAAFSPDGKKVVTGSQDNTARIWVLE
jgi:WD40 repeat protein